MRVWKEYADTVTEQWPRAPRWEAAPDWGDLTVSYKQLFQNRGFVSLWLSQLVSELGDRLHQIAFVWVIYETTGDPAAVTIAVLASTVPGSIVALPAGTFADRFNRKHLMIVSDLVRAAAVVAIPLLGRGSYTFEVVLVTSFLMGVVGPLFSPARSATIPNLVDEENLDTANTVTHLTEDGSRATFAAAGALVAVLGSFDAFYVNAGTFALSALLLSGVPDEPATPDGASKGTGIGAAREEAAELYRNAREGVSYTLGHSLLPAMVFLTLAVIFASAPLSIVIPVFADDITRVVSVDGSTAFGILLSGFFLGSFLMGLFTDYVTSQVSHGRLITVGTIGSGGMMALAAALPAYTPVPLVTAFLLLVGSGLFSVVSKVSSQTLIHAEVPDTKRGRVFSVMRLGGYVAPPLSLAVFGAVLSAGSATVAFFLQGLVILLTGVFIATTSVRGYDYNPNPT